MRTHAHTFTHSCIDTHEGTHRHMCRHTHVLRQAGRHMQVHTYMPVYRCTHTHMHVSARSSRLSMHTHTHTHVHSIHVYTHVHVWRAVLLVAFSNQIWPLRNFSLSHNALHLCPYPRLPRKDDHVALSWTFLDPPFIFYGTVLIFLVILI